MGYLSSVTLVLPGMGDTEQEAWEDSKKQKEWATATKHASADGPTPVQTAVRELPVVVFLGKTGYRK